MNSISPMSVSVNDSSKEASIQTQKPPEFKVYNGVTACVVQILHISIGVVGITSNLLALIIFLWHKPLLKRPANYFLISQCTINLLVSIMLILTVMIDASHWPPSAVVPMCYLWNGRVIFGGLSLASFYNIALLTVERYFEIVHPIKHRLKISKGKVIATIIVGTLSCVITKMCISSPSVRIIKGMCTVGSYPSIAAMRVGVIANFLVEYFIPIIVFAFCYAGMARYLRRISKITQPASDAAQPIDAKISRARRNIIKTLFIVVLGFVICSSFKQFLVLVSFLADLAVDLSGITFNVAQFLSYVNCCNDPFIYGFYYEEFRTGFRKLFCRFPLMPSESRTTTTNAQRIS